MIDQYNSRIREFWQWFVTAIKSVNNPYEDSSFINSLDKRVSLFEGISWELGPGFIDPQKKALVFSPSGNRELYELTSLIIDLAPKVEGWELYSAKPPKKWQMRFSMEDECGNSIEINASDWLYAMERQDDGTYCIKIIAPEIDSLSDDLKYAAVEIVLDGELGEDKRIRLFDRYEIVDEFDDIPRNVYRPIKFLKEHFMTPNSD